MISHETLAVSVVAVPALTAALLAVALPAAAQNVVPFTVVSSSGIRLANDCLVLNAVVATGVDDGAEPRWRATVLYIRDQVRKAAIVDMLRLDLRRGAIREQRNGLSGLALLYDDFTARCADDKGPLLMLASRVLSARDLAGPTPNVGLHAAPLAPPTWMADATAEHDMAEALDRFRRAVSNR